MFVTAAIAAVLMVGGTSASAAQFVKWSAPMSDGSFTGTYGNTGVIGDASGNFTDEFDFTLPTGISSFTISSTFSGNQSNNIDFSTVSFNGADFVLKDSGQNEYRTLNNVNVALGGAQHLIVAGHTGGGGSYDGVISFTPSLPGNSGGAIPEPGAWALMIAGFGGAGAMLRRRRQSAGLAAL